MDRETMIAQMALQAGRIRVLAEGVSDAQACWKPDAESWSILEVVNHLADEEVEDFRTRLDILLHRPGEEPPDIDPQGWVTARGYNQRDLAESLERFLAERQRSLAWLRGLAAPNWQSAVLVGGNAFFAGDMAASWVSHDLLHMRQLVELHWAWTQQDVVLPYNSEYAGGW